MKATHIDYLHPGHLRVETGAQYPVFTASAGAFVRTALCVAPSAAMYRDLRRPRLPKWRGDDIVDGVAVPRK